MKKANIKKALNKREIKFLEKAFEAVESNLDNSLFGVEELCKTLAISRSHLHRQLNNIVGLSASNFIRQIRLNHAKKLLEKGDITSSEISYMVGFSSQTYFTKCFHDYFGYPPGSLIKNKGEFEPKYSNTESFVGKIINLPKEKRWLEDVWGKKRSSWRTRNFYIATLLGFIGLILLSVYIRNIIQNQQKTEQSEKSIAVLPLRNGSGDEGTGYIANSITEEIINELAKNTEFRIPGRTSVEQFRGTTKSITEIAEILNVSFILEGIILKFGDQIKISLQLLNAVKDEHIWAESFEYKYEVQFDIIRNVAEIVTKEVRINITPQEERVINKIPSYNVVANDLFLQARDRHERYEREGKVTDLNTAVVLYNEALRLDSAFARSYTGLAFAYIHKHSLETFMDINFLDSAYELANIALQFDKQLDEAYYIKGLYYEMSQINYDKALVEYDQTLTINPNYYKANRRKAWIYMNIEHDIVKTLENLHKYMILNRELELPEILRDLSMAYQSVGLLEKANFYAEEAFKLDKDTLAYFIYKAGVEEIIGNFENELDWALKAYKLDSISAISNWTLGKAYFNSGEWERALNCYYQVRFAINRNTNFDPQDFVPEILHTPVYALYQVMGEYNSNQTFNWMIGYMNQAIKLKRAFPAYKYYDLAGIYVFLKDKEKAYNYLNEFEKKDFYPLWMVNFIKRDPLFDSIRDEDKFKMIVKNIEMKYLEEQSRVKEWLVVNSLN